MHSGPAAAEAGGGSLTPDLLLAHAFTLEEPIHNGIGKIRVDDSTWKIRGENCAVGTRVEVTGVDGTILEVKCEDPG